MVTKEQLAENQIAYFDLAEWDAYEEARTVQEAEARTDEFYDRVVQSNHVGVTELAPYVTIIPNLGLPLAERCDSDNFGVRQVLHGIVRAGSHGFALATAYNMTRNKTSRIRPGRSYITQINKEPHGNDKKTKFIAPLWQSAPGISLGGQSTLAPELVDEGQHFVISAGRRGEIRLQAKKLGKLPFQLITATSPLSHRPPGDYNPLDEVGTWAPPSDYVKRKLKLY